MQRKNIRREMSPCEVVAVQIIQNLQKLERRVRSELIRAQGICGNGETVAKLEGDLALIQAQNNAAAALLDLHVTYMIAFDHVRADEKPVRVTIQNGDKCIDVFYEPDDE